MAVCRVARVPLFRLLGEKSDGPTAYLRGIYTANEGDLGIFGAGNCLAPVRKEAARCDRLAVAEARLNKNKAARGFRDISRGVGRTGEWVAINQAEFPPSGSIRYIDIDYISNNLQDLVL